MKANHDLAEYGYMFAAIQFARWAGGLRHFPTCNQVIARFGVGRATAYRWLALWAEVEGIDRPSRNQGRRRAA